MNKKKLQEKQEIHKGYTFEVKSIDRDNFTVEGIFSTEDIDRHGEIVMQNGWKLDNYRRNPVVLWAHKSSELPIAKMLDIGVDGMNQLAGKMQFAVKEYPFAATVFEMIAGGFQRAFSAGFMNEIFQIDQGNDTVILNENELFEVSCVPIPANALALVKEKGIDTSLYEKEIADAGFVRKAQFEIKAEEVTEEKAIEFLSKSQETIHSAIRTLTGMLKPEIKADNQDDGTKVEHPVKAGGTRIPVKNLNKAIRAMLLVKKSISKQ